jgi:hypothetical protein
LITTAPAGKLQRDFLRGDAAALEALRDELREAARAGSAMACVNLARVEINFLWREPVSKAAVAAVALPLLRPLVEPAETHLAALHDGVPDPDEDPNDPPGWHAKFQGLELDAQEAKSDAEIAVRAALTLELLSSSARVRALPFAPALALAGQFFDILRSSEPDEERWVPLSAAYAQSAEALCTASAHGGVALAVVTEVVRAYYAVGDHVRQSSHPRVQASLRVLLALADAGHHPARRFLLYEARDVLRESTRNEWRSLSEQRPPWFWEVDVVG